MKTIAHGDAATVVWLNPDSRRNSAVLIEPEAVFTSTTTSQKQITTKIKSVGSGGQISTRSVQKVFRRNQTNWSSDSSVISADSEPAARLHWADWSSLAAAVCVMIPPEICSAPSPLHLTATLHLLSAARTTSWHTLVTLKLWNIQMCWNITFNRHFESYFTGNKLQRKLRSKSRSSVTLIASVTWLHLCSLPAVKFVPAGHRTQSDYEPITSKQKQHQKKAPDWLLWSRKWTQNWMLLRNLHSGKVRWLFKICFGGEMFINALINHDSCWKWSPEAVWAQTTCSDGRRKSVSPVGLMRRQLPSSPFFLKCKVRCV